MKPFDLEAALAGAPVVTRDGREVTEIEDLEDPNLAYSIQALVAGQAHVFTRSGRFYFSNTEDARDLFMAEAEAHPDAERIKDLAVRLLFERQMDAEQAFNEAKRLYQLFESLT